MTHYTVVVFDDEENVDDLLEPYDENLEVDWYKYSDLSPEDIDTFMAFYREKYPESKELGLREMYALYGANWHGLGELLAHAGPDALGHRLRRLHVHVVAEAR